MVLVTSAPNNANLEAEKSGSLSLAAAYQWYVNKTNNSSSSSYIPETAACKHNFGASGSKGLYKVSSTSTKNRGGVGGLQQPSSLVSVKIIKHHGNAAADDLLAESEIYPHQSLPPGSSNFYLAVRPSNVSPDTTAS